MRKILLFVLVIFLFAVVLTVYRSNSPNQQTITDISISRENPQPAELNGFKLLEPITGDTLNSPFTIRGYVPKNWLFEGQFGYELLDSGNNVISGGVVLADWNLPQENIPFIAVITYHTQVLSGYLVFKNDNPSGLPENEKSYRIPVIFSSK